MHSDTIYQYLGRETEWVALCGFDCIEVGSDEEFTEADAPALIESVWEFCEENCNEAGTIIPSKDETIHLLTEMIRKWNAERQFDEG